MRQIGMVGPDENADSAGLLLGRVAVVTGASGGIGQAIAQQLAAAGADVVIHGRSRADLAEKTAKNARELGRQTKVILRDLADPKSQQELVQEAWDWRGSVYAWINAAGVDVLTGEASRWS